MPETIKTGRLSRSFTLQREAVNAEARTVSLAFSSEQGVERWFGTEILDHSPQAVRLGRLAGGGPLLVDHDSRDHIGTVESVEIGADRVGRAVVRFGKSARADEVFNDVVDGIRRNVSVGYEIHSMVMTEAANDGALAVYRATDWEPLEISIVSIPADTSVGVGRSQQIGDNETTIVAAEPLAKADEALSEQLINSEIESEQENTAMPQVNEQEQEARGHDNAVRNINEIMTIGHQFAQRGGVETAREFIAEGKTDVNAFRAAMMDKLSTAHSDARDLDIGLSAKETQNFSMVRAINALVTGDWTKAGFEREASRALAGKLGRDARGFFVPNEVQRRDLTVGTPTAGGHTVATDRLASDFITMLVNRMLTVEMGAKVLSGLQGNVAIPRQTGGATAYWIAEGSAPTESQQAFDQVPMSPKTVGAFSDISRKLLLQSSIGVEQFVRGDLATVLALALDLAAINGSGSGNQPTGILNVAGIGSVVGGTNGAAPTWANIVDLESQVSIANADIGSLGYLINAKTRGKLKTTSKVSGQNGFIFEAGETPLNGYRAGVTNQVPSNLTKGTANGICSALIFGNWADLVIGQWGALDIMVDPYTGSASGTVRVVALQDADIAVRNAASFAAMKDALTT